LRNAWLLGFARGAVPGLIGLALGLALSWKDWWQIMSRVVNADRIQIGTRQLAEIYQSTTTLTDAQVKALPTTPITLVAAPGAGLAIEPLYAVAFCKAASGAYTNINAAGWLTIRYASTDAMSYLPNDALITAGSATRLSDLLGSTTPRRVKFVPYQDTEAVDGWGPVPGVIQTSFVTNAALTILIDNAAGGVLTGGHAANTLTVVTAYQIVVVP